MKWNANPIFRYLSCILLSMNVALVAASAEDYFGTAEETEKLTNQLIEIIDQGGVEAGLNAIHDPKGPFQASRLGIHILEDGILVADSRDPELELLSYAGVPDLNGLDLWEGMVASANASKDYPVLWYSYDDPDTIYLFTCAGKWQKQDHIMVWICR